MGSSLVLTGGAATAKTLKESISLTKHGFSAGDVIRWDYSTSSPSYFRAQADSAANAEVLGIVSAKVDENTFELTYGGYIDLPQFANTSYPVLFLSGVCAGGLTHNPPSALGTVVKPVVTRHPTLNGFVLNNYLGTQIGGSSTIGIDEIQPVGTIMPFAGSAIPDTWLPCEGNAYSIDSYPELYSKLCYADGARVPMYGHIAELTLSSIPSGTIVGDFVLLPKDGQIFPSTISNTGEEDTLNALMLVEGQIRAIDTVNKKLTVSITWRYNTSKKYFEYVNAAYKPASNYTINGGNWGSANVRGTLNGTTVTDVRITHFYTPDLTSRFIVGASASALLTAGANPDNSTFSLGSNGLDESRSNVYGMGAFGGEEKHTLTVAEMPGHTHAAPTPSNIGKANNYTATLTNLDIDYGDPNGQMPTDSTGGNQPHNNMPPYLAVRYIIKAKPYTRAAIIDGVDLPYSNLLVRSTDSNSLRSELLSGASGGDLVFYTNSGEASKTGTERMRLTAGGTLGIGVASGFGNTYTVQVAGNVQSTGTMVMASPFMFRNRIINGNMRINQRYGNNMGSGGGQDPNGNDPPVSGGNVWGAGSGTPGGAANTRYYNACDRWAVQSSGGSKAANLSIGSFIGTPGSSTPVGFKNYLRVGKTGTITETSGTDYFLVVQPIEGDNVVDFGWDTGSASTGKSATVSFWVRSSVVGKYALHMQIQTGNTTTPYLMYPTSYTINSANTWEYKTVTIPPNNTGVRGALVVYLYFGLGKFNSGLSTVVSSEQWNTINSALVPDSASYASFVASAAGNNWDITGVQLEVGTVATPFEHLPVHQQTMLCQRYYTKSYRLGVPPGSTEFDGGNPNVLSSTAQPNWFPCQIQFRQIMYKKPTLTIYRPSVANTTGYIETTSQNNELLVNTVEYDDTGIGLIVAQTNAPAAGTSYQFHYTANAEI